MLIQYLRGGDFKPSSSVYIIRPTSVFLEDKKLFQIGELLVAIKKSNPKLIFF
jgi:hypothetical protein